MLFGYLGDQALHVGPILKMGVLYVKMASYEARRYRVRRNLNFKVPDKRLAIDGISYVH